MRFLLDAIDKKAGPFSRWGGSSRYAEGVIKRFPPHKTYVELFAGAASVLFTKEPSEREILIDLDPEVINALTFIKNWSPAKEKELEKFNWKCSRAFYEKLMKSKPSGAAARFHRFIYISRFGWSGIPSPSAAATKEGTVLDFKRYGRYAERLKKVEMYQMDYQAAAKKFDGPQTFFFIDPPYPEEWSPIVGPQGEGAGRKFDLDRLKACLLSLKGAWMLALGDTKKQTGFIRSLPGTRFAISVLESQQSQSGGGSKTAKRYFVLRTKQTKVASVVASEVSPDLLHLMPSLALNAAWREVQQSSSPDEVARVNLFLLQAMAARNMQVPDADDSPVTSATLQIAAEIGLGLSELHVLGLRKAAEAKLSIPEITPASLKKVPNTELLSLHRRMHQLWGANFGSK